jgi:uncharacterized membrane protein
MSVYAMVVMIVLIVTMGKVLGGRHRIHRGTGIDNADSLRLQGEVQQLKERIQVLERVITDSHSSVDLDREIERLRDR